MILFFTYMFSVFLFFYFYVTRDFFLYFEMNILSSNLSISSVFSSFFLFFILIFFVPFILFSSTPSLYLLSSDLFSLLGITFSSWFISFFILMTQFDVHLTPSLSSFLILFSFNNFIYLLRPITLMLRIFININLGHFLVMMSHLSYMSSLFFFFVYEFFVYAVQSYVFLTLSVSYFGPLSLNKNVSLTMSSLIFGVYFFDFAGLAKEVHLF